MVASVTIEEGRSPLMKRLIDMYQLWQDQQKTVSSMESALKPFNAAIIAAQNALFAVRKILGIDEEEERLNEFYKAFQDLKATATTEADQNNLWKPDDLTGTTSKNPVHIVSYDGFALVRTQTVTKTIDAEKLLKEKPEMAKYATITLAVAGQHLSGEELKNFYGPSKVDYAVKFFDPVVAAQEKEAKRLAKELKRL